MSREPRSTREDVVTRAAFGPCKTLPEPTTDAEKRLLDDWKRVSKQWTVEQVAAAIEDEPTQGHCGEHFLSWTSR
jgi:hypothetical protein